MSWLITGSNGQLGKAFHRALINQKYLFVDRMSDLTDSTSLANCLQREKPKVIVNCTAYTAVDAAEDDEQTAMRVIRGRRDGTVVCGQRCFEWCIFD